MATHARNRHPVPILESVAPRVAPSADPVAGDSRLPASRLSASRLSAIGLGSIGKATGALSAPVVGLVALIAVGAGGAGVGAGLGSLPGKPGSQAQVAIPRSRRSAPSLWRADRSRPPAGSLRVAAR